MTDYYARAVQQPSAFSRPPHQPFGVRASILLSSSSSRSAIGPRIDLSICFVGGRFWDHSVTFTRYFLRDTRCLLSAESFKPGIEYTTPKSGGVVQIWLMSIRCLTTGTRNSQFTISTNC